MPFVRRTAAALSVALAVSGLGACGSSRPEGGGEGIPEAAPITKILYEQAASDSGPEVKPDERSLTRVLAYVNGEVVNYRDVLLRVAPQLAAVDSYEQKAAIEQRALVDIIRERVVDQAAREAGIEVTREQLEKERSRRAREIERNGGTLDAYLAERGMTRRELDDQIRRENRMSQYLRAAMGLGGAAAIRVRPMTDPYPSPREARSWYERNKDKPPIRVPDTARVRVLGVRYDLFSDADKVAARAKAERALARLRAGEDFVPVYRDANRDAPEPDPNDGLLSIVEGRVSGGAGADWIVEFANTKPRGTLSDVIEKGNAFYVLRAEGFTAAHTRPYEESYEDIQEGLGRVKRMVASYEVELALLESAAVTPRERFDLVRDHLSSTRRRLIDEAGL